MITQQVYCFLSHGLAVRLERGERVREKLKELVKKEGIEGGFFQGLGAVEEAEVAFYDLRGKRYLSSILDGAYELLNISGNLAWSGSEVVVQAHVSLTDESLVVMDGHLVEARVGGTVELWVRTSSSKFKRSLDQETGLKLLNLA